MAILRREAIYLWYYLSVQLEQILPYWLAGVAIGSVISVFGKSKINAAFAAMGKRKLGALGLIPASLLGIASPLCMYGTIPIAASFSRKGVKADYLAAFMMASGDWTASLFGENEGFGVLMAATIGVPMYMCGGGTIPLLQEWLWQGMSMGAAASFMIIGPATKTTNLGALKIAMNGKRFLLYLVFVIAFSLGAGFAVNRII